MRFPREGIDVGGSVAGGGFDDKRAFGYRRGADDARNVLADRKWRFTCS